MSATSDYYAWLEMGHDIAFGMREEIGRCFSALATKCPDTDRLVIELDDAIYESMWQSDRGLAVACCFEDGSPMGYHIEHLSIHQLAGLLKVIQQVQ